MKRASRPLMSLTDRNAVGVGANPTAGDKGFNATQTEAGLRQTRGSGQLMAMGNVSVSSP